MKNRIFLNGVLLILLITLVTGCSANDDEEKNIRIGINKKDEMVIKNPFISYNKRGVCYIPDGYARYQDWQKDRIMYETELYAWKER